MNIFNLFLKPRKELRISRVFRKAFNSLRSGKNGLFALFEAEAYLLPSNEEFMEVCRRLEMTGAFPENRHPFHNMIGGRFKGNWLDGFKEVVGFGMDLDFLEGDYDGLAELNGNLMRLEYDRQRKVNDEGAEIVKELESILDDIKSKAPKELHQDLKTVWYEIRRLEDLIPAASPPPGEA